MTLEEFNIPEEMMLCWTLDTSVEERNDVMRSDGQILKQS